MKKILLLLATAFLCAGIASAQDAQLNKKNLVVKEWNTTNKGTRTLDHITHYSPEGRKIDETEYDSYGKQK